MRRRAFPAALALLASVAPFPPGMCHEPREWERRLAPYGERLRVVERGWALWARRDRTTWTLLRGAPGGELCAAFAGRGGTLPETGT